MDGIADFFQSQQAGTFLDDRTWSDLLLDDVFAFLDRTESAVGQQILYRRFRQSPDLETLAAFEALVGMMSDDAERREGAQTALSRLQDSSAFYLHRLARPGVLMRKQWHVVFPVWTAAILSTLLAGVIWPWLLFVAVLGIPVNLVIRILTARRIGAEINWFRQVGPLISTARTLAPVHRRQTAPLTSPLEQDLPSLRRLGAIAKWVSRNPLTTGEIVGAFFEYLNLLFLIDANAVYFAGRELESQAAPFLRMINAVGEIDAAIATASFRAGARHWIRPQFAAAGAPAVFADVRHPLVDDAVPNTIALAPPHGVLVTGSNMSGKSTFLRTIGVNAVLAQTVHTCLASEYDAPMYNVRSCIGRADDLLAGKSYYLVEVESVLALVTASASAVPHLFIFDELFRGTNAVERIAAGEAVLRFLISGGGDHVVIAATHDGELVDLLHDEYAVYHLGDALGPTGLVFDYHLVPGPATSRNAIALLQLNGAPDSLVRSALNRAAALDLQRRKQEQI